MSIKRKLIDRDRRTPLNTIMYIRIKSSANVSVREKSHRKVLFPLFLCINMGLSGCGKRM